MSAGNHVKQKIQTYIPHLLSATALFFDKISFGQGFEDLFFFIGQLYYSLYVTKCHCKIYISNCHTPA